MSKYVTFCGNNIMVNDDDSPILHKTIKDAEKAIKKDVEECVETMQIDIHDDKENLFSLYRIFEFIKAVEPDIDIKTRVFLK